MLGLLVYTLAIITCIICFGIFSHFWLFCVTPSSLAAKCFSLFFVFSQMSYIYLSISCVIASQIHFEQNKTVLFMWQFSLHGYTRKSYNELIESNSDVHELKFHQSKFTIIIYNHQQLAPFICNTVTFHIRMLPAYLHTIKMNNTKFSFCDINTTKKMIYIVTMEP